MCRRRQIPARHSLRRAQLFQRRPRGRLVQLRPGPRIRGKNSEIPTPARLHLIPLVHRRILKSSQFPPVLRQHLRHPHFHPASEHIRIPVGEDRLRLGLPRQFDQRRLRVPFAHDEPAPDGPQIPVQRRQRPAQKGLPRCPRPAVFLLPFAHHINRYHLLRLPRRRRQRRIVRDPKIPSEPMDGRFHGIDHALPRVPYPAILGQIRPTGLRLT